MSLKIEKIRHIQAEQFKEQPVAESTGFHEFKSDKQLKAEKQKSYSSLLQQQINETKSLKQHQHNDYALQIQYLLLCDLIC